MSIWSKPPLLADIEKLVADTMISYVGIEVTEIGDDYLRARMPVDHRTCQPDRIVHGGASVVLAETLASIGCMCTLDWERQRAVGLEINANHLRAAKSGFVTGTARPVHIGRRTQVWEVRIADERDKFVCISRVTMSVLDREQKPA